MPADPLIVEIECKDDAKTDSWKEEKSFFG